MKTYKLQMIVGQIMQKPFADFQLLKSRNIAIRAGEQRILFDPTSIPKKWRSTNTTICISHAHADHIAGFRSTLRKLVTPETLEIYKSINNTSQGIGSAPCAVSVDCKLESPV